MLMLSTKGFRNSIPIALLLGIQLLFVTSCT